MSAPVAEKVRQIAAEVLGLSPGEVTDSMSPQTVADWDSVQHLNLVLAIESRLGVRFDPREIEQMRSIGDIIRITSGHVQ